MTAAEIKNLAKDNAHRQYGDGHLCEKV